MSIDNLLLKHSKGTILEKLAKSVVLQKFQNVEIDSQTKIGILGKLGLFVLLIIVLVIALYAIPYGLFLVVKSMGQGNKSVSFLLQIIFMAVLIYYLIYALPILMVVTLILLSLMLR